MSLYYCWMEFRPELVGLIKERYPDMTFDDALKDLSTHNPDFAELWMLYEWDLTMAVKPVQDFEVFRAFLRKGSKSHHTTLGYELNFLIPYSWIINAVKIKLIVTSPSIFQDGDPLTFLQCLPALTCYYLHHGMDNIAMVSLLLLHKFLYYAEAEQTTTPLPTAANTTNGQTTATNATNSQTFATTYASARRGDILLTYGKNCKKMDETFIEFLNSLNMRNLSNYASLDFSVLKKKNDSLMAKSRTVPSESRAPGTSKCQASRSAKSFGSGSSESDESERHAGSRKRHVPSAARTQSSVGPRWPAKRCSLRTGTRVVSANVVSSSARVQGGPCGWPGAKAEKSPSAIVRASAAASATYSSSPTQLAGVPN